MRKKGFFKNPITWLVPTVLALGALLGTASPHVQEADGYTASSLPTTIYLNDTDEDDIRSYYSSLNNLSDSERQGTNLLKNLKTILKNGQKYYNYDSGDTIWKIYEIADRDWTKSPASSITKGSYDSSKNKITNYVYGSSGDNPYLHALYINRNVTNETRAWGNHNQDQWGINREHVWPKSQGFNADGAGGARGDPMHLMCGNGYTNNIHNNYDYGYVKTSTTYVNCGSTYSNQSGNLRGTSLTKNSGTVFEPQDCDKGDIARAIFYMAARYNYLSGSDSDGIDSNNPNLEIVNLIASTNSYTSSTTQTGKMGILTDLLAWHHADPVDSYEIHRNNLLYTNFTNNRNPFIDFPEWVDFIWGTATYSGKTYQSYSSTPTGHATPSTDAVNGYNSGASTPTGSVTLSSTSGNLSVEATTTISATSSNGSTISWTSSDSTIASVSSASSSSGSSITITANKAGNAVITASATIDGNTITANYYLTVSGSSSNEVSYEMLTSIANIDESANYVLGLEGTGFHYSGTSGWGLIDSPQKNTPLYYSLTKGSGNTTFTAKTTINSTDYYLTVPASKTFTLSAESSSIQLGTTFNDSNSLTSYAITNPSSTTYHLRINGTSGLRAYASATGSMAYFYKVVPASDGLSSILLDTSGVEKAFTINDEFNYDDLSVIAVYESGAQKIVVPTSVSTPDMSTTGTKTVTVSYTDGGVTKTATYQITVSNPIATSISLGGSYPIEFTVGDSFSAEGMTVTEHFNNGSTESIALSSCTFSGYDMNETGTQTVTVTYSGLTATYSITVNDASNKVTILASSQGYSNAEVLDSLSQANVYLEFAKNSSSYDPKYYNDTQAFRLYAKNSITICCSKKITSIELTFADTYVNTLTTSVGSYSNGSWTGNSYNATFTVSGSYGQKNISSIVITYDDTSETISPLISISLSGTHKTSFLLNGTFSYTGLVVTAHYLDETSNVVTPSSVSTPSLTTVGEKTVTVTYIEQGLTRTATYTITVTNNSVKVYTLTLLPSTFVTTSYSANNNDKTLTAYCTTDNTDTLEVGITSYQVMQSSSLIQFQKNTGFIYNKESFGTITNISATVSDGTLYTTLGSSVLSSYESSNGEASSGEYFNISVGNATGKASEIVITFEVDVVDEPTVSSLNLSGSYKTSFIVGDSFTFGGTVTAVYSNSTTKDVTNKATFSGYDLSLVGNQTVTVTYNEVSTTYNITISIGSYGDNDFIKVTSASELKTGDEIIFVGSNTSNSITTYYSISSYPSNYFAASSVTLQNGVITKSDSILSFTIDKSSSNYRFINDSKAIATSSNDSNYVAFNSSSMSSDTSYFSLVYSDGLFSMTGTCSDHTRTLFRFNYNSGNPRFSCYAENTTMKRFEIFKKATQVQADTWAQSFLDSTSNGTTCNVDEWSSLATSYNDLPSNVKSEIINVVANASTDYSTRAQAMARYDFFMSDSRFNQGDHFITGRVSSSSVRPLFVLIGDDKKSSLVVAIFVSLIGLSAIGGYFYIKRRKEQHI